MNYGKHAPSSRRRSRKPVALLLAVVLLLGLAIGGTVAYLVTKTPPVNNTFTPSHVSCEVVITDDGIQVQNTGNIDAWIRVYVTANYVNTAGNVCAAHSASAPTPGEGWISGEDGFYYHNKLVKSGDYTTALFATPGQTTVSDGCKLEIEVFASAIQPGDAAISAWKGGSGS